MKVVCAMSGGVDSSVAALILKEKGFEVIGVTMKLWECFKSAKRQSCCSAKDSLDAKRVCEQLNIPHHVIDMRESFKSGVVEYFAREYCSGKTPNPCVKCNELIKFDFLRKECQKLFGTDLLATGHYARIEEGKRLLKGIDHNKDQSYFLFGLKGCDLPKTIFPLGALTKDEVRSLAKKAELKTAQKSESQEICFIVDDDYPSFIRDFYPDIARSNGEFVDMNGKVLGRNEGAFAYTIGQRRGLGFGFGKRKYVVSIDVEKNRVVLGDEKDLLQKNATIENINWIDTKFAHKSSFEADVKIRYRTPASKAMVLNIEGNQAKVVFDKEQRAITPGQAAVFYNGDEVLGGGYIK